MKIIGKLILILLIAVIVIPIAYMAWRAGQPMDLPQFKGLTFYQYMSWRKESLHQMAVTYHAVNPHAQMGGGLDMCYNVDLVANLVTWMPMSGFYTLAGAFPGLVKYVTPDGRPFIPKNVILASFLQTWWLTFEKITWYEAVLDPQTEFVEYCRLQPNIPTPAQLQTLLANQQSP